MGLATYLTVVGGGYILHGTKTQLWSLEGVCPSSLVIQVAEVLRGNWGGGGRESEEEGGYEVGKDAEGGEEREGEEGRGLITKTNNLTSMAITEDLTAK